MAQHISDMLEDLYAALDEGRSWSLVRMGDGEAHTLRGIHAPWAYCENRCDTHDDAGSLREMSLQAIAEADWVGWHQDQGLCETLEAAALLPRGWTKWRIGILTQQNRQPTPQEMVAEFGGEPPLIARSQFAWCNLHMGLRRGFVERVLRKEQLFLVGEPMQRWLNEVLRPAGLGVGAVVWSGPTTISTMSEAMQVVNAFEKSCARVMFASLGVWALPIVGRVKQLGGMAIDWGHLPDHQIRHMCAAHKHAFDPPYVGKCPNDPGCQAHWAYKLNLTEEDSPTGTMAWYRKAGAPQCLPEKGF